jgi:hypothetical protein
MLKGLLHKRLTSRALSPFLKRFAFASQAAEHHPVKAQESQGDPRFDNDLEIIQPKMVEKHDYFFPSGVKHEPVPGSLYLIWPELGL